jgi:hypothetical protein
MKRLLMLFVLVFLVACSSSDDCAADDQLLSLTIEAVDTTRQYTLPFVAYGVTCPGAHDACTNSAGCWCATKGEEIQFWYYEVWTCETYYSTVGGTTFTTTAPTVLATCS